MAQKQVSFRIEEQFLQTSQKLKNYAILSDDEDPLFQFPIKSENVWHSFVYQNGLVRISQMRKKYSKMMEAEENENNDDKLQGKDRKI